jgi:hypothetical protein
VARSGVIAVTLTVNGLTCERDHWPGLPFLGAHRTSLTYR